MHRVLPRPPTLKITRMAPQRISHHFPKRNALGAGAPAGCAPTGLLRLWQRCCSLLLRQGSGPAAWMLCERLALSAADAGRAEAVQLMRVTGCQAAAGAWLPAALPALCPTVPPALPPLLLVARLVSTQCIRLTLRGRNVNGGPQGTAKIMVAGGQVTVDQGSWRSSSVCHTYDFSWQKSLPVPRVHV